MNYNPEYVQNRSMLIRCKKMYTFVAIAYFITCIPFSFISFYTMILTVENNVFSLFLDSVFKVAIFFLGYIGNYRHNNMYSYYATGVGVLDIIVCGADNYLQSFFIMFDDFNAILLNSYIILCIITIRTNKKYAYLEQQEGFPHFSEIFEEQKAMKDRDVYAERYEEIKKASSGKSDMDEL